ncbi:hypothetical protein AB6E04_21040 [Vibrio amylolyticus]
MQTEATRKTTEVNEALVVNPHFYHSRFSIAPMLDENKLSLSI